MNLYLDAAQNLGFKPNEGKDEYEYEKTSHDSVISSEKNKTVGNIKTKDEKAADVSSKRADFAFKQHTSFEGRLNSMFL